MIILPAIDIKDGKCVRLYKGDYNTAEQVADDYMQTAESFKKAGAAWIHMVDLDGAKDAEPKNKEIFIAVAKKSGLNVEVGGGIRNIETVEMYLKSGISRCILGSVALKNPELVKLAVNEYGDRIAVGIDAKNGKVATEGWLENSDVDYIELAVQMCKIGVKYFIFTDIDKDGTLSGPNHHQTLTLSKTVSSYGAHVIASGGVKTIEDLITIKKNGIYGAICGKSIYSGTIDLARAIVMAGEQN